MTDEISGSRGSRSEHKSRRPHRKSRYGCTKCKERRIKCDELTPQCSRCSKMNLTCRYPKRSPGLVLASESLKIGGIKPNYESSSSASPSATSLLSPASTTCGPSPGPQHVTRPPRCNKKVDSALRSRAVQTLTPDEFELFKHYLEHTSRDPTVDNGDQYALQVGIPNLACESKPLMRSVLALAAVCKCCDAISQPLSVHDHDMDAPLQSRGQVLELLSLAHRYHMGSLQEIQTALHDTKSYDYILANAAMMGMYGSGSYRARVWLAKTAAPGEQAPCDFIPEHAEWMSLFRAARLAYAGILNNLNTATADDEDATASLTTPKESPTLSRSPVDTAAIQLQYEYRVSPLAEQPRAPTDHALGPILAATVDSALAKLSKKAIEIVTAVQGSNEVGDGNEDAEAPTSTSTPRESHSGFDLEACLSALDIFSRIVAETFPSASSNTRLRNTPGHGQLSFDVDIDPVGRLLGVSPWLRRYTASITSMVPSRLPRRIIMAFIHKIPTRYLNLVEEMVSFIPAKPYYAGDETAWMTPSVSMSPEPSPAHQLALDIFAHWLVLVILLDNVWWIGDIGTWELGRIVSFRNHVSWRWCRWEKDEAWWPESMLEVSRQFDKHR